MAGTASPKRDTLPRESVERQLAIEHNKLVDDVETLRAAFATLVTKMNADAGITDNNYASVAAASLTAAKVQDQTGTAIS